MSQVRPARRARGSLLIDGEWVEPSGDPDLPVVDPSTGELLGHVAAARDEHVTAALAAAERGFTTWSRTSPEERGTILRSAADLLSVRAESDSRVLTEEQGKPLTESLAEIHSVVAMLHWFADHTRADGRRRPGGQPEHEVHVEARPIGPVVVLTPWNFPVSLASRKVAAALAVGCSVIVKPAPEAPTAFLGVAHALQEAGLPDGVLGVLNGDSATIAQALVRSPVTRAVSFTGSTLVGRLIASLAGEHVKPATLELGGHAPVIVTDDVDPEDVAEQLVPAAFLNAGQVCVSPTRILVQEGVADEFVTAFVDRVNSLRVGPGTRADTDMGPVALGRHRQRVQLLVERTVDAGGVLRTGGTSLPGAGWFMAPTVLTEVPRSAALMNEEPFGPVVAINRYRTDDHALAEANRLPVGLAAYVYCRDATRADAVADRIEAGTVGVNTCSLLHVDSSLGGIKDSGHGRDGGFEGMAEFRVARTVTRRRP
jgi:succinate-semialdehyde dehydrogenase/glutarate-semialdehyde dehydrogenase